MKSEKPVVSKHARKTLRSFIEKEYGTDFDAVWKNTIKQYKSFLENASDYGGRKSPHFTQIYDAMFLLAFCSVAPKEHTIEELEPVSFEIFMSAFNTLGKMFSAKRKWTMDLLSVIFKASLDKDNRHARNYPADFAGKYEPYDKKNGIVRYCFTRCPLADFVKANDLGKWMPLTDDSISISYDFLSESKEIFANWKTAVH